MRSFIIIVVLSTLAACYGAAVLSNEENVLEQLLPEYIEVYEEDATHNGTVLTDGKSTEDLIVFVDRRCYVPAEPNEIVRFDVVYYGEPNVRVRRIQTSSSWGFSSSLSGLGTNVARVRLVSNKGRVLDVRVRILGEVN